MSRTPAAVWIVDTKKEHLAVEEARKLRIPIIGILDSNCDPDEVDFPIPGNDDAIRAVGLLTRVVADAVAEGLIARSGAKTGTEGAAVGAEEPLAEWERELLGGDADKAAAEATGGDAATTETPAAEADRCRVRGRRRPRPPAEAGAEAAEAPPPRLPPRRRRPRLPPRRPRLRLPPRLPRPRRPPRLRPPRPPPRLRPRREAPATERTGRPAAAPRASSAPTRPLRSRTARLPRASRSRATRRRRSSTPRAAPGTTAPTPRSGSAPPEAAEAAGFVNAESKSDASRLTAAASPRHPLQNFEEEGPWLTSPRPTSRSSAS